MVKALLRVAACSALVMQAAGTPLAAGIEFSADARTTDLRNNQSATTRIYLGKEGARRKEYRHGEQQLIEIVKPAEGILWQLMPNTSSYYEYKIPAITPGPPPDNPCTGAPALKCTTLGDETVHGRPARKWRIVAQTPQGQSQRTLWMDVERKVPLRQENQQGDVAEMRLLGKEQLEGREVEKWEMSMTRRQQTLLSYQWYDPRLELTIREEIPGHSIKELNNIKEGSQAVGLFQVPAGFRKLQPPVQSGTDYPQRK
jgi:hypothetical protein